MLTPARAIVGSLSLRRKTDQQIIFLLPDGQRMTLSIGEVKGRCVQLLFQAPQSVEILRAELLTRQQTSGRTPCQR